MCQYFQKHPVLLKSTVLRMLLREKVGDNHDVEVTICTTLRRSRVILVRKKTQWTMVFGVGFGRQGAASERRELLSRGFRGLRAPREHVHYMHFIQSQSTLTRLARYV